MTKDSPGVVSVVLPVYNGEKYLAEAISSVQAQASSPLEIIVVDDGSTDGSAAVARGFAGVRYAHQEHGGLSVALNRGIDLVSGEFVGFIDADDIWTEGRLGLQVGALTANPNLEAVFGLTEEFNSPELEIKVTARGILPGYQKGTLLIRSESLHRIGLFDETRRMGDFIDWFARASEADLRSQRLPHVVCRRRIHYDNMGLSEQHHRVDYARVLKAALDRRRTATRPTRSGEGA